MTTATRPTPVATRPVPPTRAIRMTARHRRDEPAGDARWGGLHGRDPHQLPERVCGPTGRHPGEVRMHLRRNHPGCPGRRVRRLRPGPAAGPCDPGTELARRRHQGVQLSSSTRSGCGPTPGRSTNPSPSETGLTCRPLAYGSGGGAGAASGGSGGLSMNSSSTPATPTTRRTIGDASPTRKATSA